MSEIGERIGDLASAGGQEVGRDELRPDARGARWLRRRFASPVVAVTTVWEDDFHAATVSACSMVSIAPLLLLISVEQGSRMDERLASSEVFAVNFLPWSEQFLSDQFAGLAPRASRSFAGIEHFTSATGAPILTSSIAWADCRTLQSVETGDHRCYIGRAEALGSGTGDEDDPLMYYLNRYKRLR